MRVAGYFKGVMGTGEHGRQLVAALQSQGIATELVTLHPDGSPEDEELAETGAPATEGRAFADINLLCVNADMVPSVAAQLGRRFFARRYTIGFWAWEVSLFPDWLHPAFDHVQEVWVGSRHVQGAVQRAAGAVPVMAIPQPVSLPAEPADAAPRAELPPGFRFLFAFDYLSVFARKNPLATVAAFTRAFAPGAGAKLIIKALNSDRDPSSHERLRSAVAQHPDIHLIERRLSRGERDGLMSAVDCYVSLHRAEGFGYTLAESMWLGKPVIATGYSGNVDFMRPQNSYLVDYQLVPIGPDASPYPPEGEWANPDVDHAASLMRRVYDDPAEAKAKGAQAASDIRCGHRPEAAGSMMYGRLATLAHERVKRGTVGRTLRKALGLASPQSVRPND